MGWKWVFTSLQARSPFPNEVSASLRFSFNCPFLPSSIMSSPQQFTSLSKCLCAHSYSSSDLSLTCSFYLLLSNYQASRILLLVKIPPPIFVFFLMLIVAGPVQTYLQTLVYRHLMPSSLNPVPLHHTSSALQFSHRKSSLQGVAMCSQTWGQLSMIKLVCYGQRCSRSLGLELAYTRPLRSLAQPCTFLF